MALIPAHQKEASPLDQVKEEVKTSLNQLHRDLKEIEVMLEHSQLEVGKLAQRNASITSQLQQIQAQIDSVSRLDIRANYESALETQQRLFLMRGQVEKLQSDRSHRKQQIASLDKILQILEAEPSAGSRSGIFAPAIETVERIIQAQESERQRLSQQMHDGPAQALSNFILQTEIAMRLFDIDQGKAREELSSLKNSANSTFQKVRDFIFELHPMMLDDLGLVPTLKRYIDALKNQTQTDIQVVVLGVERRLEVFKEVMAFRAVQDLVNRALRLNQANQVKVTIDMGDPEAGEALVKVVVEDNGKGLTTGPLREKSANTLNLIRERVEMVGGTIETENPAGKGARISLQIPAAAVGGPTGTQGGG